MWMYKILQTCFNQINNLIIVLHSTLAPKVKKADSGYNQKKRHYSGASKTTTMYYVRVNASDLDGGEETIDVEVSSSIYDNVVEGEYHEFTVVTDTLITGKKRVRIYY